MGLDMYACKTYRDALVNPDSEIDLETKEGHKHEEIAYWRKFNHLHGWMERLYRDKGGQEEFNCVKVALTRPDLLSLEQALDNDALYPVSGPFFGDPELYEGDIESTREFIDRARNAIDQGFVVFYDSSW